MLSKLFLLSLFILLIFSFPTKLSEGQGMYPYPFPHYTPPGDPVSDGILLEDGMWFLQLETGDFVLTQE